MLATELFDIKITYREIINAIKQFMTILLQFKIIKSEIAYHWYFITGWP